MVLRRFRPIIGRYHTLWNIRSQIKGAELVHSRQNYNLQSAFVAASYMFGVLRLRAYHTRQKLFTFAPTLRVDDA